MSPLPTLYAKTPLPRDGSPTSQSPLVGGHLALDFLNTTPHHGVPGPVDDLGPGYVNLLEWAVQAGAVPEDAERRLTILAGKDARGAATVRRRMIALREALYPVALTLASGKKFENDPDLEAINTEVATAQQARHLVVADGHPAWTWRQPLALERPLWDVSLATVDLLLHQPQDRVRQCAAPDCERVFLDTSRNGRRQFCSSSGCGTVQRVRRYRERQRSSGG